MIFLQQSYLTECRSKQALFMAPVCRVADGPGNALCAVLPQAFGAVWNATKEWHFAGAMG